MLAVCDLLGVSRYVTDEARRLAQEETGLPAGNILVSAVHTHSAVSALGDRYLIRPETNAYQKAVARRIADTVRRHQQTSRPPASAGLRQTSRDTSSTAVGT